MPSSNVTISYVLFPDFGHTEVFLQPSEHAQSGFVVDGFPCVLLAEVRLVLLHHVLVPQLRLCHEGHRVDRATRCKFREGEAT